MVQNLETNFLSENVIDQRNVLNAKMYVVGGDNPFSFFQSRRGRISSTPFRLWGGGGGGTPHYIHPSPTKCQRRQTSVSGGVGRGGLVFWRARTFASVTRRHPPNHSPSTPPQEGRAPQRGRASLCLLLVRPDLVPVPKAPFHSSAPPRAGAGGPTPPTHPPLDPSPPSLEYWAKFSSGLRPIKPFLWRLWHFSKSAPLWGGGGAGGPGPPPPPKRSPARALVHILSAHLHRLSAPSSQFAVQGVPAQTARADSPRGSNPYQCPQSSPSTVSGTITPAEPDGSRSPDRYDCVGQRRTTLGGGATPLPGDPELRSCPPACTRNTSTARWVGTKHQTPR